MIPRTDVLLEADGKVFLEKIHKTFHARAGVRGQVARDHFPPPAEGSFMWKQFNLDEDLADTSAKSNMWDMIDMVKERLHEPGKDHENGAVWKYSSQSKSAVAHLPPHLQVSCVVENALVRYTFSLINFL